jgi:hypothetical protein
MPGPPHITHSEVTRKPTSEGMVHKKPSKRLAKICWTSIKNSQTNFIFITDLAFEKAV